MTRMGPFVLKKKDENGKEIVASKYPLYFMDKPLAIERVSPRESRVLRTKSVSRKEMHGRNI